MRSGSGGRLLPLGLAMVWGSAACGGAAEVDVGADQFDAASEVMSDIDAVAEVVPEAAEATDEPETDAAAGEVDSGEVDSEDRLDTGDVADSRDVGVSDTSEVGEVLVTDLPTPSPTVLQERDWSRTAVVRGVYFTPSDRPFRPGLRERLHAWATIAREFFKEEMAVVGYTNAEGGGRTFELETAADGLWDVVFLVGDQPASHYQAHPTSGDAAGEALAEVFRKLPDEAHRDAILVYFYDTYDVSGRGLIHTGQGGSAAPWMGAGAGYALIGAHVFGVGFETVSLEGVGVQPSQAALFEAGVDSGFDDWDGMGAFGPLSRGAWASTYIGAAVHELGHAFGLEHVFGDEDGDGVENNLMGNGFRRFGGRWTDAIPRPSTLLGPVSADALSAHPWIR